MEGNAWESRTCDGEVTEGRMPSYIRLSSVDADRLPNFAQVADAGVWVTWIKNRGGGLSGGEEGGGCIACGLGDLGKPQLEASRFMSSTYVIPFFIFLISLQTISQRSSPPYFHLVARFRGDCVLQYRRTHQLFRARSTVT